jgi:hypothetical protein
MKSYLPTFTGKILSVLSANEDTSQIIADAKLEIQGGRLFLVGTVPKGGSRVDWMLGLRSAIAWDMVQDYVVFDSLEDYQKRLKRTYPKGKKKKAKKKG